MKRGDVVFIRLPAADPAGPSHVQAGTRPAIVIQSDEASPYLKTVAVIPLTSKLKARRFPFSVSIAPSVLNGLSQPSVALPHQIVTVDTRIVDPPAGQVDSADMQRVESALAGFLALPKSALLS